MSAQNNVLYSRTRQKPHSGDANLNLAFTGTMILPLRNSLGFAARASSSTASISYQSTCLNVWAWSSRPLPWCLRMQIDHQRRGILSCCEDTTRTPCIGCGGRDPHSGALMRLLGTLEVSSGWHFEATHVRAIHNVAAHGISCWDHGFVLHNLRVVRHNIP